MSGQGFSFSRLLDTDLAGTYPRTPSAGLGVDPALADSDVEAVRRDGYVILPDLLSADELTRIRSEVGPLLDRHGRNPFEGHATTTLGPFAPKLP